MRNLLFLSVLVLILNACGGNDFSYEENVEERFFLEYKEAIMPVVISGNAASNTFCIVLHGGPGDSGIQSFHASNMFDILEQEVAMVYYDQRCAGLSQGNCDGDELAVYQFVEDIDRLIELIRHHYNDDISIFILGHSWGATLALEYLLSGAYKNDIAGCIQTNGSHNIPLLSGVQKEFMNSYAVEQIDLGNSVKFWEKLRNKIEPLDPSDFDDRISIVSETHTTLNPLMDAGIVEKPNLKPEGLLHSMANSFLSAHNVRVNNNRTFYDELLAYDNTSRLSQISVPVALYWGLHDIVHPPVMVEDIYENLAVEEKELYFFEKSFHAPMAHENELYQSKVSAFIELYK